MLEDNPYIKKADVFIKENKGDLFIIAYMQVRHRYHTPESPLFIHEIEDVNIKRLAGFEDNCERRVLYHAKDRKQAEQILKLFLEGKGYSIHKIPVKFNNLNGRLPGELEKIAERTIEQYRKIRANFKR